MSQRIEKTWVVFASIENSDHSKCVDVFYRPDGTFGFEEFRRDVEDAGEWTPLGYYSGTAYVSSVSAYEAAEGAVPWLADILHHGPRLRRHPRRQYDARRALWALIARGPIPIRSRGTACQAMLSGFS